MEADDKIVVRDLYKIFGPNPKEAMDMLSQGLEKAEIFEKTGLTVGVNNASFEVKAGRFLW